MPARDVIWAVLTLNAHWGVIILLYVFGLSALDLFHAVFLVLFVLVSPSPRLRERLWSLLVWIAAVALVTVYLWGFLSGPYCSSRSFLCSGTVLKVFTSVHDDDWVMVTTAVMAILVLAALKGLPAVNNTAMAALSATGYSWVQYPAVFLQWQRRYGIYACYALYAVVALLPPIDVRTLVTLVIFFSTLLVHMHFGLGSLSVNRSTSSKLVTKLLLLMSSVQGVVLALRYLYQFDRIERFVRSHVWPYSSVTLEELGLVG